MESMMMKIDLKKPNSFDKELFYNYTLIGSEYE